MKKILNFILLCLYIVGLIGGIGYTIHSHAWVITVGVAVLGVMGWPMARDCFKNLS